MQGRHGCRADGDDDGGHGSDRLRHALFAAGVRTFDRVRSSLAVCAGGRFLEPFLAAFSGFDVDGDGALLTHGPAAEAGNGAG